MVVEDWRSAISSTHTKALNRQVTEAVMIKRRKKGVKLLNSKHEFGANLLMEIVIMRGDHILGMRKLKRKRYTCERVLPKEEVVEAKEAAPGTEEDKAGRVTLPINVVEEEEEEVNILPPREKPRIKSSIYEVMTRSEIVGEAKKWKIKVGRKRRE